MTTYRIHAKRRFPLRLQKKKSNAYIHFYWYIFGYIIAYATLYIYKIIYKNTLV